MKCQGCGRGVRGALLGLAGWHASAAGVLLATVPGGQAGATPLLVQQEGREAEGNRSKSVQEGEAQARTAAQRGRLRSAGGTRSARKLQLAAAHVSLDSASVGGMKVGGKYIHCVSTCSAAAGHIRGKRRCRPRNGGGWGVQARGKGSGVAEERCC